MLAGNHCSWVTPHVDDVQVGIVLEDVANLLDVVRLLGQVESCGNRFGLEQADFVIAAVIVLEAGGNQFHEERGATAWAADNVQTLERFPGQGTNRFFASRL